MPERCGKVSASKGACCYLTDTLAKYSQRFDHCPMHHVTFVSTSTQRKEMSQCHLLALVKLPFFQKDLVEKSIDGKQHSAMKPHVEGTAPPNHHIT